MQLWDNFLAIQQKELGAETVQKWLKTLKVLKFDACNLYLEAKDSFQVLWFEEHIRQKAHAKFFNNNNKRIKIHLSISNAPDANKNSKYKKTKDAKNPGTPSFALSFNDPDPHCTFEYFNVADTNKIPFTLCCEITESYEFLSNERSKKTEIGTFNPIFIYGPSGTGKTHLLSAIAHSFKKKGLNVIYAHAETFTEHVVTSIRAGAMSTFRQSYRNIDVLLIDDVHVFSKKGATQEEFFHTFNTLHLAGKQIIISANCSPQELQLIEPRLVSRFEWGITLPLETPKKDEAALILKAKAAALNYELNPKVGEFLLETFKSGTKAVTRALEALILRSYLDSSPAHSITVPMAKHCLADLIQEESHAAITPHKIVQAVAEQHGLRTEDILGKAQTRDCVHPRQIAMFLCREKLGMPYTKIGDLFTKDHSTVMSSVKLIKSSINSNDKAIGSALTKILKKLHA